MESNVELQKFLKVHVHEQTILIALDSVKIIVPLPGLHEVPNGNSFLEGILNFHGQSVPVYNLGRVISTDSVELNLDTPLVISELNGNLFALLVSDVDEIVNVDPENIQNLNLKRLAQMVLGAVETEQESMWILKLQYFLSFVKEHEEDKHE